MARILARAYARKRQYARDSFAALIHADTQLCCDQATRLETSRMNATVRALLSQQRPAEKEK
jgi:hypothetical protein